MAGGNISNMSGFVRETARLSPVLNIRENMPNIKDIHPRSSYSTTDRATNVLWMDPGENRFICPAHGCFMHGPRLDCTSKNVQNGLMLNIARSCLTGVEICLHAPLQLVEMVEMVCAHNTIHRRLWPGMFRCTERLEPSKLMSPATGWGRCWSDRMNPSATRTVSRPLEVHFH